MKINVNFQIALTHILTRKKQTIVAAMGVTIGIALYVFSNSLVAGFSQYSRSEMFKTIPHLRVYKDDKVSQPLFGEKDSTKMVVITNPKITNSTKNIVNPGSIIEKLKEQPFVVNVTPQVNVDLFYNIGKSQLKGMSSGINVEEADAMFNIQATMLAGNLQELNTDLNGIVIGKGIAEKMNVGLDDNISVTSSWGVVKVLNIIGIFGTDNKAIDESKSYINIKTAQQLLKEGPTYITDVYASVTNPDSSIVYAQQLQQLTEYKVEDWQTANADQLAQDNVLGAMTPMISISIMMVAAFGIYNILNMTITQKMNDIAILKANGFKGKDIVQIFVSEAFFMGAIGTFLGLCFGALLIGIVKQIYIGPPIGYFPIYFDPKVFATGAVFGMLVSLGAGYFPARKAAKVDPVEIFRK